MFCSSVLGVVEALAALLAQGLPVLAVPEVEAVVSASLCSRVRKCLLHTPRVLCLLASARVAQRELA